MESLVQKVEIQTATIAGLQTSVETMNETIKQQKVTVVESIKVNNDNISMLKKSISQTPNCNHSAGKQSYADAARKGLKNATLNDTPKSSKSTRTPRSSHPVLTGTSNNVIGKPLSPINSNRFKATTRQNGAPRPEKAIWISRIHRETTEEELAVYIKESIGIKTDDINVRKLVKKDREISSYSFVSFRINCSSANFNTLMNPMYWPSNSQLREFEIERNASVGARLTEKSPSKNEIETPIGTQVEQTPQDMNAMD